jgi:DNA-binding response OmpR family regulator
MTAIALTARKAGIARILLAEEDHEIQALWKMVLDRAGYEVITCGRRSDLPPMIRRLSVHGLRTAVDLVICDARMLGDDLRFMFQRQQAASDLPNLVVIAAYQGRQLLAQMDDLPVKAVFDQPFRIQEQLAVLRALLPGPSETEVPRDQVTQRTRAEKRRQN